MKIPFGKRGYETSGAVAYRLAICGLALLAGGATWITARWGIGLSPDSLVYIGVARSLLDGNGVTYLNDLGELSAVNHYPPLYPFVIAGSAVAGMDPLVAAQWLSACLFAANVGLISAFAWISMRSCGAAVAAAFFTLVSFPMAQIHSMAWSEPLFLFCGFLSLWFLTLYLQGAKRRMLYASAAAGALSCLARYAGISLVGTGLLGIFFGAQRDGKKWLGDAVIFAALGCLPLAAWLSRSLWLTGSATNRMLDFHPPSGEDLTMLLNSACLWIFPPGILQAPIAMRVVALALAGLLAARFMENSVLPKGKGPWLAGVFLSAYGLFIFAARVFFDSAIIFDTRILAPAYVPAMLLVVGAVAQWITTRPSGGLRSARLLVTVLIVIMAAAQLSNSFSWWKHAYLNGIGFSGPAWRNSEALHFVNRIDSARPIYTNVPDVIYMLTGRHTIMVPRKVNPKTRLANHRYDSEVESMKKQLKQSNGVVAYFYAPQRLWYLPPAGALEKDAGLRLIALESDGSIYQLRE